ncbi:MAG: ABC transporter substrate binding protein [Oscillospiraceae bacterium]|nr:ABC transporter substrate binding protein [Oscillospiraceae bacterium]
MKQLLLIVFLLIHFLSGWNSFAIERVDGGPHSVKKILLLASYHLPDEWTKQLSSSIIKNSQDMPFALDFNIVVLDALRFEDSDIWDDLFQRNLPAIRKGKYQMIVALDDVAVDVLLRHAKEIPAEIPIVFAGYENSTENLKNLHPNLTGVRQNYDCKQSLHIGLSLFPQTTHVLLLANPRYAQQQLKEFLATDQCAHKNVAISCLPETVKTTSDVFAYLDTLPKDTLVLFAPWRAICDSDYHSMQAFSADLAQSLKRPYLISLDTLFGYGALGGVGASAQRDGEKTAKLIQLVFERGSAIDIPIENGDSVAFFDYNVMMGNGLDFKLLPSGTILYNRPPTFWSRPEFYWSLGGGIVSLLFVGMFIYLLVIKKTLRLRYALFNELPGRVCVVNRNGDVLYLNDEAQEKYSKSKIRNVIDFSGADHEKVLAAMHQTMDSGKRISFEYSTNDSKRMIVMSKLHRHFFGEDAVVWVSLDNTELQNERNRAKEYSAKLERSMKLWNALLNTLPVHVFAKNPDDHFNYVFCNKAIENFFHRSSEQIIGKNDAVLFPQKSAHEIAEWDNLAINDEKNLLEQTVSVFDADGNIHFFHSLKQYVELNENERMLLGVAIDITELETRRRESETAQRLAEENAEKLKLTLNSIGDGVIVSDLRGNIVMLNPVAERMTGYANSEAAGKPHEQIFKIISYDDGKPSPSPLTRSLRTGNIVELANHTDLLSKDGETYHISDSAAPIRDRDDKIVGAILVFRDVTEEYTQRDQLRRTVALMEAGAETTCASAFYCDVYAGTISGSKLLPQLIPCEGGKMPKGLDWIIPEDRAKLLNAWHKLTNGEIDSFVVDYRAEKDGEMRFYQLRSSLAERRKNVLRTFGVVQDVTDITRNAAELKNITTLWERALQLIPVIFCVKDIKDDFRYISCNQRYAEIVGKPVEQMIGQTDYELFGNSHLVDEWLAHDREVAKQNSPQSYEEYIIDHKGEKKCLHSFLNVAEIDGKAMLLCASMDITDLRRRLELEEAGNRILNRFIAENSLSGLHDYIAGELLKHIDAGRVILAGCDPKKTMPYLIKEWPTSSVDTTKFADWKFDIATWGEVLEQLHNGKIVTVDDLTESHLAPRMERPLHPAVIVPIFESGKMCGFLLAASEKNRNDLNDIDAGMMQMCANILAMAAIRDRQQRQLQEALNTKQMVLDNIKIPIGLYDGNGELLIANREAGTIIGRSAQEITTSTLKKEFKEEFEHKERTVMRAIRTKKSTVQEMSYRGHSYMINAEPIIDGQGQITNVVQSATMSQNLMDCSASRRSSHSVWKISFKMMIWRVRCRQLWRRFVNICTRPAFLS